MKFFFCLWNIAFGLLLCPFCLNFSLFCIYFTFFTSHFLFLFPLSSFFSFPFILFLLPFPLFYFPFHIFSPKWRWLIFILIFQYKPLFFSGLNVVTWNPSHLIDVLSTGEYLEPNSWKFIKDLNLRGQHYTDSEHSRKNIIFL
jgi:hypothetical protein